MINKNEVKKDLYKSKVNAKFSHYVSGNLYYTVELSDGIYQFPIATVESGWFDGEYVCGHENITMQLSQDLGTTTFEKEMKASDLNRWIGRAIDNDEFIKVGEKPVKEVFNNTCSCGLNERVIGEYYCRECLNRNPFLCA